MTKLHGNCRKIVHRPCSSCISSIGNLTGTPSSSSCQLRLGVVLRHLSLSPYTYSNFAVNSLGNSLLNSFSSSPSSYHLSSPYFLSNSSTNSFVFSKFFLFSQVSSSTVYPFHLTRNFSFPLIVLLFKISSTSNSFCPSIISSFGGIFFCPSTCGL